MENGIMAKEAEITRTYGRRELSMEELDAVCGGGLFDGIRKLAEKLGKTIKDIFD